MLNYVNIHVGKQGKRTEYFWNITETKWKMRCDDVQFAYINVEICEIIYFKRYTSFEYDRYLAIEQ